VKKNLFFLFLISSVHCFAQQKYWVTFKDKAGATFNPYEYFDERTIAQRTAQHIPLADRTDFPVSEKYIAEVKSIVNATTCSSRWLNGIAVYATVEEIKKVKNLSCVSNVEAMNSVPVIASEKKKQLEHFSKEDLSLLAYQTARMQGNKFKEKNLDGAGIRIAVFDGGFPGVNHHAAFNHLWKNKKIIATYDFVKKVEFVYAHNSHGASTLSCITGMMDTIKVGLATGAEFLLARTEIDLREPFSEEENWLAAAEWADQHGANIISSSLGYTYNRYFNTEMNGKKSLVARAANLAAAKGMLVVSAAGNEGNEHWKFIDTPADADSVLTAGGTDPYSDAHIYFSSFGPTSDGRLKPNVSAPANVIAADASGWSNVYGTSFSTPLIAGFAACVWQAHRDWSNMQLYHEIEKSSHLYPYFDYAHGYGIPQAGYFTDPKDSVEPTFDFVIVNDDIKIILREKYSHSTTEQFLGYNTFRNLYYRIDNKNGVVRYYAVILAEQKEALYYLLSQFQTGDKITVHFEGYTNSYTVNGNENTVPENKQ
jgi:serine protease AprX